MQSNSELLALAQECGATHKASLGVYQFFSDELTTFIARVLVANQPDVVTFRSAVEHVTADGVTKRSFSTSEGWAMVHSERLHELLCAEERVAALETELSRLTGDDLKIDNSYNPLLAAGDPDELSNQVLTLLPITDVSVVEPQEDLLALQIEFERQAAYQGATDFTKATSESKIGFQTYECWDTELAWRLWANKTPNWRLTKDNPHPGTPGLHAYEQVPCLIEKDGSIMLLQWNCAHQVWDTEDGDDFFCKAEDVTRWVPLPELLWRKVPL